ncbi:Predicted arabinose efflux permease, MFS family [Thalassobacillus cyri]|uniref:Predicted arabinose efflux permease, MFS family n=1 Tax=Thalassobacillus cyri TaxID=571932 RepID=A0A1H4GLQ1_9BACI|nr:MFS transporter [Thalassobacillus cyri]SEB09930.1 Predicted arabinose efflux permease, MFS family [Thalassobacillus cyri]
MKQAFQAMVLIASGIFIASNLYTMLPLHPALAEHFGTSPAWTSLTSTLFIICYAVGLLCFGILSDIYSNARILQIGMAAVMAVTGIIALTDSFGMLLFLRAVQGFLAASFAPPAFSYTFKQFSGSRQSFVIAMINTGFLFAGIFGQLVSGYFGSSYSYQMVFVVFSFCYLSCAVLMAAALRPPDMVDRRKAAISLITILSFFKQSSLQKLYLISFFLLFTIMLFYSSFEWFIEKNPEGLPLTLQQFRMLGLIGVIPAFFVSRIQKRLPPAVLLCLFLSLMMAAFIPAMIGISTGTLIWASVMMVASTSVTIPMVIVLIGSLAVKNRGSALSIYSFVLLTGASAGSFLAPFLPLETAVYAIAVLFAFLTLIAYRLISERIY